MNWEELKERLIKSEWHYFHTDKGVLLNGDCLDIMENFPEKTFDAIITDPPYGTTACKWDTVIPFDNMWRELKRIRKDKTPIVLFGSEPFSSYLRISNIKEYREDVVWLKNKSGSGLNSNQKHIKIHEIISVFSKKGKYTFNPQKWLVEEKEFLTQRKTFKEVEVGNNIYSKMIRKQKKDDGIRNPLSIVSCKVPFTPSKTKTYSNIVDLRFHPTQKPVALMEYLIKTYTNEGDIVLDFTCGSGSTLVACENLNRKWIGIEINLKYCEIAKKRILEITKQKTLKGDVE